MYRLLHDLGVNREETEPASDSYPLQPTTDQEASDGNADAKTTALAQQFLRNEALVDQVAIEAVSSPAAAVELCAITKLFAAFAIDLETALALSRAECADGGDDVPADAETRWTLPECAGNGAR